MTSRRINANCFPFTTRIVVSLAVCLMTICFLAQSGFSQVPMKAKDSKSTINISDLEKINLYDGDLSLNLPLTSLGGRGISPGISLNIEQAWRRDEILLGYSGSTPNMAERIMSDPYALTGLFPTTGGYLVGNSTVVYTQEIGPCSGENRVLAAEKAFTLNFTGFGGQSFNFISQQNDGDHVVFGNQGCSGYQTAYIGTVFLSTDGSGTKFISDGSIGITDDPMGEGYGHSNFYPSGLLRFPDGAVFRIDGGLVSWIQDRNGNKTFLTNTGFQTDIRENRVTSIKDSLNREITTSTDSTHLYASYKGINGASRTITVGLCASDPCLQSGQSLQWLSTLFPWIAQNHYSNALSGGGIIKDVEFPNGQKYEFFYNSFAELSRVEMPTGGSVEYSYETVGASIERRITERRVYSNGTDLDNKTKYEYSDSIPNMPGNTIPSERWTKVKLYDSQNNLKSVSKHYFYGCIQDGISCQVPPGTYYEAASAQALLTGREFKSEVYDSDGTTLLRQSETSFEPRRRTSWTNGPSANRPYVDYHVTQVVSTLADTMQVSKTTFGYDQNAPYNLQTDTYEYDYGSYQPGNFLRRTHVTYETGSSYTANTVNLLRLPLETWISTDVNGNAKVARTQYEYDNYTTDATHAALLNRSNISGHNSSYGTGYTTRGNATRVSSYADAQNSGGAVSTYSQYDIAGNTVKGFDARGNASTLDYSDKFGSPDNEAQSNTAPGLLSGQSAFAFVSSTTNSAGYTSYAQRDFSTGSVVDSEDMNGNISTSFFNDALDRPTQSIGNNNRSAFKAQATAVYDDVNHKMTVTSDSKAYGDNLIKSEAYYDGFGRTTESRDYETSSNYIVTLTQYDFLGRAYKTSNPYRPYLSETAQWSTTTFDSMGRVTQVKTPDNNTLNKEYYGSKVQVTDQYVRGRAGETDALGRMVKVTEYNNGTSIDSFYTYDVVGRLRKTSQTEGQTTQNRYFMYNDLGQLIRARQVEQGTNANLNVTDPVSGNSSWSTAYSYDNNANLVSTTNVTGVTTTGTYDNLNRLTLRNYSDSTPDVTFTYDDTNIANSKGKLTAVSSSVSAANYTAFDVIGRVKSSSQTTSGQTYTFSDYTYDLSGALVSQVYPSGRVVDSETDNLGRLAKVSSQTPSKPDVTYLSNISYTSFGAARQARLGNGNWENTQFDAQRMQVSQISLGASATDTSLLKIEYNYGSTDNNGTLRQQKITLPGAAHPLIQNYNYDTFNRLQSATETVNSVQSWKQTFSYDRFGNRTFDANNTTTLPANNGTYNPGVNAATNRFASSDGYVYDVDGNLTQDPTGKLYSFDAENRMKSFGTGGSSTNGGAYVYDGNGKRVRKTVGSQETLFIYDAMGKLAAEYTLGQTVTTNGTQYLTTDSLGSPRAVTNVMGQVVSRHDYMPFGEEVLAGTGSRTTAQGYGAADLARQKFTGYERDDESGLDYAQARFFNSSHGRFTSVDPLAASANIKAPQTLNRYSYGNNSPYKFTDPLGLAPCGVSGAPGNAPGRTCNTTDDVPDVGGSDSKQKIRMRELVDHIVAGDDDEWNALPDSVKAAQRLEATATDASDDDIVATPNSRYYIYPESGDNDPAKRVFLSQDVNDAINVLEAGTANNWLHYWVAVKSIIDHPGTSTSVTLSTGEAGVTQTFASFDALAAALDSANATLELKTMAKIGGVTAIAPSTGKPQRLDEMTTRFKGRSIAKTLSISATSGGLASAYTLWRRNYNEDPPIGNPWWRF